MNLYGLAVEMIGEVPVYFEFIYILATFLLFLALIVLVFAPVIIVFGVCRK